ncbi:MAG: hypothetical protein ACW986_18500 [Promethearchaeota archaeon]|jgi:hypothetical protein
MVKNSKVMLAGVLIFISGILHLIVSVLSLGLLIVVGTTLIFGFCFVLLGVGMILLVKRDLLNETRKLIVFSATISFLNSITLLTHFFTKTPEDRIYLYFFLIFFIAIDFIIFPIFFIKKVELDKMEKDDKLSYFSIVVIKGLGLGLLVNGLAWIGLTNELNPYMITYILIFGSINMIYGELLYRRKEQKKIQISAIPLLILGLIFELMLCSFFPNGKSIADVILYSAVIPIRFYYLIRKF